MDAGPESRAEAPHRPRGFSGLFKGNPQDPDLGFRDVTGKNILRGFPVESVEYRVGCLDARSMAGAAHPPVEAGPGGEGVGT